jgi:hypothetical protein
MSNRIKDGGPAFPRAPIGEDCERPYGQQEGMSLRDWIAGQALTGMLASPDGPISDGDASSPKEIAIVAYRLADAMIAAREGKP